MQPLEDFQSLSRQPSGAGECLLIRHGNNRRRRNESPLGRGSRPCPHGAGSPCQVEGCREEPWLTGLALQHLAAVRVALAHFSDSIQAFLLLTIFVLDIARNLPALVSQQPQYSGDRSVAFTEGQVGAVVVLSVLDMKGHDFVVLLAEIL